MGDAGFNFYLDPHRDYSVLSFNHTVTLANSFIYQLPFGKDQQFLQHGVWSWIAGGWQVSGLSFLGTGTPLFLSASGSQLNAPGTTQVPNEIKPFHRLKGIGTARPWFDTSAFVQPSGSVLGNVGKNVYSGPGSLTFDGTLIRNIPIHEQLSLQLRADAFNAFNHPTFNNPDTSLTDSNFGKVTVAGGARAMQLAATLSF